MPHDRYDSPDDAEEAFYQAFGQADLEAMMAVWAPEAGISCIHPMGKVLRGEAEVREGWLQLFTGGQRLHFRTERLSQHRSGELSVHTVHEHIQLHGDSAARPPIIATNIYKHTDEGWRLIVHHASPSVIDARRRDGEEPEPKPALH